MLRFGARSEPGPTLPVGADLHRARKRELSALGDLQTPEGRVLVRAADAIVWDDPGRQCRVSRRHFGAKYDLVANGRDRACPVEVRARQMAEPFEALLGDGQSLVSGALRDWLVDYRDGSLGAVADAVFSASYELID